MNEPIEDMNAVSREKVSSENERGPVVQAKVPSPIASPEPAPVGAESATRISVEEELHLAKEALEARTSELAASLSLLNATLESTADGIVALDLSGEIVSLNSKFAEIWGLTYELIERLDVEELVAHAAQQLRDPEGFRQLSRTGRAHPEDAAVDILKLKDGRTFERHTYPRWLAGKCVGVVVSVRDVTDQKRAETALRISEEKYRLLWETADDAFLLFDESGMILEANAAVARIFGYTPDEVTGREMAMLQPERLREGHEQGLRRYLDTGVKTQNWGSVDTFGLHRDGREIPIEIAFNHLRVENRDLFAGFIRDISERKRTEQAQAVFAAIVDSSNDAIVSKTLEGIITSWNNGAERIFGYTEAEVIGKPILVIIPPERADEEPRILARQARGEGIDHFETVRVRKDGRRIHVSVTISPIKDSHGRIVGVSKIARDITAQKMAEEEREELLVRERNAREEAQRADRTKDEFLATLSHELRTPLTAILGWSQMISANRLSEAERTQGLEIIQRNAHLQSQLVDDILDVSRIITGKLRLEVRPVELSHVIEAAVESVLPASEAKEIRLQRVMDSGTGLISGDPARLQQVVWNLLANAIKFTPRGGRVQVRLERVNSHIEIIVSDTGGGIDPEILPYIFERFRQADQSSTRRFGGLGLGLAIVRHIVENHGGSVEAESPGLDQGATFTVKLPLMAARQIVAMPDGEEERVHSLASSGLRSTVADFECPPELNDLQVLVVDDEEDARGLVKKVLESCGAVVTSAASVAEAMEALRKARPDVMVSDVGMPGEDGYSLIKKVRALSAEDGGQTPAAALTAYARMEDRLQVLRAGFQIHLPKPVEPAELVAVVANLAKRVGR